MTDEISWLKARLAAIENWIQIPAQHIPEEPAAPVVAASKPVPVFVAPVPVAPAPVVADTEEAQSADPQDHQA